MVTFFSSRFFAIADPDGSLRHVDIGPFYPADLGLAHCGRHCEANNSSERYLLFGIGFRVFD